MIKVEKRVKEGFSPRSDRLVLLSGAYAFIDGIFAVYVGMRVRGDGWRWWMMIPGGLVGIAIIHGCPK